MESTKPSSNSATVVFSFRDSSYFNDKDFFEFKNSLGTTYKSKANFDKGFWWLNDYYKATTVLCRLANIY